MNDAIGTTENTDKVLDKIKISLNVTHLTLYPEGRVEPCRHSGFSLLIAVCRTEGWQEVGREESVFQNRQAGPQDLWFTCSCQERHHIPQISFSHARISMLSLPKAPQEICDIDQHWILRDIRVTTTASLACWFSEIQFLKVNHSLKHSSCV